MKLRKPLLFAIFSLLAAAGALFAAPGTGLTGQYFTESNFVGFYAQEVDPFVDFNWSAGTPPLAGMPASEYSIRWTGQIQPLCTDNFTFTTISDDGARLWINGALVIDDWGDHSATTDNSAPIALTFGVPVSVRLEFRNGYGIGQIALQWSAPSCVSSATDIPMSQLYPDATLSPPSPTPTETVLPSWACPVPDAFNSGSLSSVWSPVDIDPITPGAETVGSTLQVSADGEGVLGGPKFSDPATGDSFSYIYQPVWGDFDVKLLVDSVPTTAGGQAGLMLRESVQAGAEQVFAGASQTGVFQEIQRLSTGAGNTNSVGGSYVNGSPQWVRLQRIGNSVQAYYSANGTAWTPLGPLAVFSSLSSDLLLGVAVSSQDPGVLGQAQVSNFDVISEGCETATPTLTPSFTISPTWSFSPTFSETFTQTPTFSITPTFSVSPTYTVTPTVTPTPTITMTFSVSPTYSISPTFTPPLGPALGTLVAYPNPFSDKVSLGFSLGAASDLELVAYDVAGEAVFHQSLQRGQGPQILVWPGTNTAGARCASGVYLMRLKVDGGSGTAIQWITVAIVR